MMATEEEINRRIAEWAGALYQPKNVFEAMGSTFVEDDGEMWAVPDFYNDPAVAWKLLQEVPVAIREEFIEQQTIESSTLAEMTYQWLEDS